VLEMTRLIEVSRNYTEVATILQQQSEMRRDAITRLAEVPV
jgi:flagellar basal body rod protein FlgG